MSVAPQLIKKRRHCICVMNHSFFSVCRESVWGCLCDDLFECVVSLLFSLIFCTVWVYCMYCMSILNDGLCILSSVVVKQCD